MIQTLKENSESGRRINSHVRIRRLSILSTMVKLNTNTSTNQTNTKLNTNQNPSKKIFVEVGKLILNLFEHGKGKEYPTEEQI